MKETKILCNTAIGKLEPELVLKNGYVVNVFTEKIERKDVAITGGRIAGVGEYSGKRELDCTGKFICPGFIDAHIHLESTMLLPENLSQVFLRFGTTAVVADPHEIVNVCGADGFKFMLDRTENIPLNVFLMLPSSVPSTRYETNGGEFTVDGMKQFCGDKRVLGLAEVMCYTDVLNGSGVIFDKIDLNSDRMIDGHAPGLSGRELQAYICAGIRTEHECSSFEEAHEKASGGMYILVRNGSAARNLDAIVSGLVSSGEPADRYMFCSDDAHIAGVMETGHIGGCVRRAIELGIPPVKAVKMASFNVSQAYGIRDMGAVAPGFMANLVLLDSLEDIKISSVYCRGKEISELEPVENMAEIPEKIAYSVHIQAIDEDKLKVTREDMNHVIEVIPGEILTRHLLERVGGEGDVFIPDETYSKLCVFERHRNTGNTSAAIIKGMNIKNGAMATSVSHDSHNIIAVGDNDSDIAAAVNDIIKMNGGYAVVSRGKTVACLPLPVAGLMSDKSMEETEKMNRKVLEEAHRLGVPMEIDPIFTLSFLALPVIPEIRLTDTGLFDVVEFRPV